jgi:Zn-dependent peptidase ImmA (M78 family)/transcriptional regulator with XRE-family HTH domain
VRSASDDVAYINGRVLEWARKRSGVTLADIAKKLKATVNQVQDWESGESCPAFKTAQDLAKMLRVPFGILFLPTPPEQALPLPDFRTLSKNYRPSPDFLELLNGVLVRQDWYREYAIETGEKPTKFVGKFTNNSKVGEVANDIRLSLGMSQTLRHTVRSWSEYLTAIVRNAEDAGILVMRSSIVGNATRRKVSHEEVQGFAISDDRAPLVFINSEDFKASQIFTMAHELAHIWIGQSAISNPDETNAGTDAVESFCNKVAAEVLVPEEEFLKVWKDDTTDAVIAKIARWFWVSTLVILRRAHDAQRISKAQFFELRQREINKIIVGAASSGGDYYRNIIARMGGRLTYAVLGEVQHQRILLRDASRLLDMKIPTLLTFAERAR